MTADPLDVDFSGKALRLAPGDVARLAWSHAYPLEMIEALLDVEAAGSGFDDRGRPKMLSEPHVLYRTLGPGPKRDRLVRAGLCYPIWGAQPYPATSDANYARLRAWCAEDEEAALASCSWGIGQVMGGNHAACGYATATAMVSDCMHDEALQLDCVLRYLEHAGLDEAIRRKDCLAIGRGYNGRGAAEAYAARLQAALTHHAAVPLSANRPPAAPPALRREPIIVAAASAAPAENDLPAVVATLPATPLRQAPPTPSSSLVAGWFRAVLGVFS